MSPKSIIGGKQSAGSANVNFDKDVAHKTNTAFWNTIGSDFLGATALPDYGAFLSESKLHLLGDICGKAALEIGCGHGHSLQYIADKGASELWGIDISPMQIERTREYLISHNINSNLVCSPMENECNIPKDYFDIVYAVYAIGWTTDLDKTFRQVHAYLKQGGIFVFSWSHPIHKCVLRESDKLVFSNSYFDESWYSVPMDNQAIMLSNRKLSTYINALANNGFCIEQLVEETDEEMFSENGMDDFEQKAKMLPVTFVIKARKQ